MVPKDLPGVATGVTEMSWGRMAPLLATILVTCWAQAEDTSADGSLMSNANPAATTTIEPGQRGDMGTSGCCRGDPCPAGTYPRGRRVTWCAC